MMSLKNGKREPAEQEIAALHQRIQQMEQIIETLQDRVTHYRRYFDIAHIGIATTSPDSGWIEFNYTLCEMFGYTPEELLCTTWADLTHPDDLAEDVTLFEQLVAGQTTSYKRHKRFIRKDGSVFYGTIYIQGVYRPNGSFHHVVSMLHNGSSSTCDPTEMHHLTLEPQEHATHSHQHHLLQGIIDNSPAIIYVKDRDGRYLMVNRKWSEVLKIEAAFVVGKTDDQLFSPEISESFRVNDQHVIASRIPLQIEEHAPHEDGLHTYRSTKFPLFDETGALVAVGGISTDITEHSRIEEKLQQLTAMIDNSSEFIGMATLDGHPIYLNQAGRNLVGLETEEEVWQHQVIDYFPPEEQERVRNELLPSIMEQGRWGGEILFRHFKTGDNIPVHWGAFLVTHPDTGKPTAIATITRDLTQQKQAEDELRMFKMLAKNAPDGVAVADMQGTIFYMNPAFRTMTGRGDEAIGQPISIHHSAQEHKRTGAILQQVFHEGSWQGVRTFQRKDGSSFDAQLSVCLVTSTTGQPLAIAALARDITEQQRIEAERAALQQQMIEAQQATISELSTPLLPLTKHIVAMPLVGTLDSTRAQQVLETLLEGIAAHQADTALVDITGIKVVDTQVAQALIQTAQAVRLLGAQVILTGIQPQIAQTLVHLGVELRGIVTQSTLQAGIAYALNRRNEK